MPQKSGCVSECADRAASTASRALSISTNENDPSHAASAVAGWSEGSPSASSNRRRYSSRSRGRALRVRRLEHGGGGGIAFESSACFARARAPARVHRFCASVFCVFCVSGGGGVGTARAAVTRRAHDLRRAADVAVHRDGDASRGTRKRPSSRRPPSRAYRACSRRKCPGRRTTPRAARPHLGVGGGPDRIRQTHFLSLCSRREATRRRGRRLVLRVRRSAVGPFASPCSARDEIGVFRAGAPRFGTRVSVCFSKPFTMCDR